MKSILVKLILLFSVLLLLSCASTKEEIKFDKMIGSGKPVFYYNLIKSFGRDDSEFKLISRYKIEYDRLHFERLNGKYVSKFNVSFAVFKRGEEIPVKQEFLSKEVVVERFEDTDNHKLFDFDQFELFLPVGEYTTELKIESKSGEYYKRVDDVTFWYENTLGMSNLTLFKSPSEKFDLDNMIPIVSNRIDEDCKNIGIYFELLSPKDLEYTVEYSLMNSDRQLIYSDKIDKKTSGRVTKEIIAFSLNNNKIGDYIFKVVTSIENKRFERYIPFNIRWRDDTAEISNLNEAIRNLIYIVDDRDTLSTVLRYDYNEKRKWFNNFWGKVNKGSGDSNIVMEEYYRRVNFSNVNFSSGAKKGWKTDRGQVFIIYGEPDEIQKYEYSRHIKPYEVWVYYNRGRQFIFDYVAGDFRLRRE
ncbi:MAG: hypothetical protein CR982_01735 [Candidatus Cloacimonadota bacterium]|nr:MAG: hypothetical protein CR982_01735 [Candidatus Cloacimonadota bacterium]PIE78150.1 MAG: hypothetical protein CSA15_09295 [Candidatus Delongbacteria bacterium]